MIVWIIVTVILSIALIIFIVLWGLAAFSQGNSGTDFNVSPGLDADPLMICDGSCIFNVANLTEATNLCNSQPTKCQAFVYTPGSIKFVNSSSTVPNLATDLYIRTKSDS